MVFRVADFEIVSALRTKAPKAAQVEDRNVALYGNFDMQLRMNSHDRKCTRFSEPTTVTMALGPGPGPFANSLHYPLLYLLPPPSSPLEF